MYIYTETHTPNLNEGWEGRGAGPGASPSWLRALGQVTDAASASSSLPGGYFAGMLKSKWNDAMGSALRAAPRERGATDGRELSASCTSSSLSQSHTS